MYEGSRESLADDLLIHFSTEAKGERKESELEDLVRVYLQKKKPNITSGIQFGLDSQTLMKKVFTNNYLLKIN